LFYWGVEINADDPKKGTRVDGGLYLIQKKDATATKFTTSFDDVLKKGLNVMDTTHFHFKPRK
jgi:uridylate kinase